MQYGLLLHTLIDIRVFNSKNSVLTDLGSAACLINSWTVFKSSDIEKQTNLKNFEPFYPTAVYLNISFPTNKSQ